jgi:hypothetical protein
MDRMNQSGFVASVITQSHACLLLPVGPSEGHSLLKKSHMWDELWHLIQVAGTTM